MFDYLYLILFITGFAAGAVDAIAGGGGLISLPVLLGVGIPPHIALGTNKLQSSVGTLVATFSYYRAGFLSFKFVFKGLIFGLIGAIAGAFLSQILSGDILKKLIPLLLLGIFFYTLFSPKLGVEDKKPRLNELYFFTLFGFVMGFYDGFFGPGTGALWVFALTFFLGFNLIKATAYTKVFNLNSNLVALFCFAIGQNIDYKIGFFMAAGQLLGGKLGAHLAIKQGAKFIRYIFISVVSMTIVTLFYQSYSDFNFILSMQKNILMLILLMMVGAIGTFVYVWTQKKRLE